MKNLCNLFFIALLAVLFSCHEENELTDYKQEKGAVWRSGGLFYCGDQIHLDNGDTLIVHDFAKINPFKAGDRVSIRYKEIGTNENCNYGIDCELIEIKKTK